MIDKEKQKTSKFLSLVLRHKPEIIGLILDVNGWTSVEDLIKKCNQNGHSITRTSLKEIVETNDKRRFAFDQYESKIRANQGHSIKVDLNYKPATPPEVLYHGTPQKFVNSILRDGLIKGERHHVHLSADEQTAITVGSRKGLPVIFEVEAKQMFKDGFIFFQSENGVWLTEKVPSDYLILR